MFFRRFPLLLFVLALGVLPMRGQSRHQIFSIGGNVRDAGDHHALEFAQVNLRQVTGVTVQTAFTRGTGDFLLEGLPNGEYIIDINARDYDRFQQSVVISGISQSGLSIFLSRSTKAAALPGQLSISAHQLSVPRKARDEFEKGIALIYVKSDYLAAIAQFQLAIKDFPTYYEAYSEEGGAYYQLQQMDAAEEAMRKSIDLSQGQYADALFNLAALLTDDKRYAEAETISRKAISADKSSWRGPFELARALTRLNHIDEAEKNAQQSRDMMPDNPPVYLLLANVHIQKKDYPALVRDLTEYLRLSPGSPEADQARKTRDRVQAAMDAAKDEATAGSQSKSQDDEDEDEDDPGAEKTTSPAAGPDTSGLPSLPPPTRVD